MGSRAAARVLAARVLAVLAGPALLAGCALPGTADPDGEPTGGDPDPTATMPSEIPSWLLECGAEENKEGDRDETLQLTTLDLTAATWSMPAGFRIADGYTEDNPVETLHSEWIAEPVDPPLPTLNVVNVVLYTGLDWGDLADECGRVPLEAVEAKLAEYREVIDAQPVGEAEMTEVAGLPAIHQDIGLARYSYTGYWLFTETQLMHVYCQWTEPAYQPAIVAGCDELVGSVRVPGA